MAVLIAIIGALLFFPLVIKSDGAGAVPGPASGLGGPVLPETCGSCHADEAALWAGSHHDRAMMPAARGSIRAPFAGEGLEAGGEVFAFEEVSGVFQVRIREADGALSTHVVTDTFGWTPLQQFLIEGPGGRKQVLPVAWDARPRDEGGERWFHLYADEGARRGDPFHWSGRHQTWNTMCALCHSTELKRNVSETGETFATTSAAVNVTCAACHSEGDHPSLDEGPVSQGAAPASPVGHWQSKTGKATKVWQGLPRPSQAEVCAPCHSRRAELGDGYEVGAAFLDFFDPVLLDPRFYHLDGQIDEENYVWGSFLQSRMSKAGVQCSDCHDPHSLRLKEEGNALCGQCHAPEVFDGPQHHHHERASQGALCVSCHMPAKTYMEVDARRDHFIRVPDPALSAKADAPDVCTGCHDGKETGWAVAALTEWGVQPREDLFAEGRVLLATNPHKARAILEAVLQDDASGDLRRAAAAQSFGLAGGGERVLLAALDDTASLVRLGALKGLADRPLAEGALEGAVRRLDDPLRAVRFQAAWTLLPHRARLGPEEQKALDPVLRSLLRHEMSKGERAEAQLNQGLIRQGLGEGEAAEAALQRALVIDPGFVPARINLAELLRVRAGEGAAQLLLQEGLKGAPGNVDLSFALGLSLVRSGDPMKALPALATAAEGEGAPARYPYVYAVALNSYGYPDRALQVTGKALERFPVDAELLLLGVSLAAAQDKPGKASTWASLFREVHGDDPRAATLPQ